MKNSQLNLTIKLHINLEKIFKAYKANGHHFPSPVPHQITNHSRNPKFIAVIFQKLLLQIQHASHPKFKITFHILPTIHPLNDYQNDQNKIN